MTLRLTAIACTVNSCLADTLILWTEATCKSPAKTMKKSPLADSLYCGHQMMVLMVPTIIGVDWIACIQFEFGLRIRFVICFPVELFDTLVLHACDNEPSKEQSSASGCDVLPALNLLCQWMAGSSTNIWNGEMLKKTKWVKIKAFLMPGRVSICCYNIKTVTLAPSTQLYSSNK